MMSSLAVADDLVTWQVSNGDDKSMECVNLQIRRGVREGRRGKENGSGEEKTARVCEREVERP